MQFSLSPLPKIEFGSGVIEQLAQHIQSYGSEFLLITGATSWQQADWWPAFKTQCAQFNLSFQHEVINGEPSPELIDQIVARQKAHQAACVVAVGGGSALDAGKAIAGLLLLNHSVMDFLEGVGPELPYQGPALPFIAVPTTAGTGSEATKNAVLSLQNKQGFKKSFRSDLLMPKLALVDPNLLASCPQSVIAANGMDALTQVIESYVSARQNIICNTLGETAIRYVRDSLLKLYDSAGQDADAREKMAYAALISGINLAQTGLGSVHGLASPMGAFFPIPHGVVCGTLLAKATEVNIRAMQQRDANNPALAAYKKVAQMLHGVHFPDAEIAFNALIKRLWLWTEKLNMPRLSDYGVTEQDIEHIVKHSRGSSMQTNPIVLTDAEIAEIIRERL